LIVETLSPRCVLSVKANGPTVEVTVGNNAFSLDYDTAFRFAVLIFGNAKKAKRNIGHSGRSVYGFADLTDANMDELKAQRSRNCGTTFIKTGT